MSRRDVARLLAETSVRRAAPPELTPRRTLPQVLTLAQAKAIAGSLGVPSKMPGYSYGLDARRCHRGRVMAKVPGSICAGCFALNGFYATWRPALVARERRHAGLEHPRWVDAMVRLILHYCTPDPDAGETPDDPHRGVPFFRWHDSGDLQSVDHLARIVEVCERTPSVRHWLPTREYELVAAFRRAGGRIPANLCVRLSALMIDAEPPRAMPGLEVPPGTVVIPDDLGDLPTSTVHTAGGSPPLEGKGAIACRAIEVRDNHCGPCRACWDPRVRNVSYPQH